jgi:enterochelin esterase-like enzyme
MRVERLDLSTAVARGVVVRVALMVLVCCGVCWGQGGDEVRRASSNVDGAEYPRVHSDSRVDFQVIAPAAQKVQVQIAGATLDMLKHDDGTWTVTSAPQVPGFHYYSIVVDGAVVADPASKTYFGIAREASAVEIPEKGVDFYDAKNVPHGDVREHWYFSKVTGGWRRCYVYAPPGYDASLKTRYPVLYLQHGAGEDETGWIRQGHANFILDNLIAAGKARPMLIVMDLGYATRDGSPIPAMFGPSAPPLGSPQSVQRMKDLTAAFEDVVITDLVPMVDATYRTVADRDHRALAGLSMGAMQAFRVGFDHLETFAYIGGFSGAPIEVLFGGNTLDPKTFYNGILADPGAFNKKVRLLWLGVGEVEGDRMLKGVTAFHESLDRAGIHHVFYLSPGTAHEWQTWRRDLNDLAPRLFVGVTP